MSNKQINQINFWGPKTLEGLDDKIKLSSDEVGKIFLKRTDEMQHRFAFTDLKLAQEEAFYDPRAAVNKAIERMEIYRDQEKDLPHRKYREIIPYIAALAVAAIGYLEGLKFVEIIISAVILFHILKINLIDTVDMKRWTSRQIQQLAVTRYQLTDCHSNFLGTIMKILDKCHYMEKRLEIMGAVPHDKTDPPSFFGH